MSTTFLEDMKLLLPEFVAYVESLNEHASILLTKIRTQPDPMYWALPEVSVRRTNEYRMWKAVNGARKHISGHGEQFRKCIRKARNHDRNIERYNAMKYNVKLIRLFTLFQNRQMPRALKLDESKIRPFIVPGQWAVLRTFFDKYNNLVRKLEQQRAKYELMMTRTHVARPDADGSERIGRGGVKFEHFVKFYEKAMSMMDIDPDLLQSIAAEVVDELNEANNTPLPKMRKLIKWYLQHKCFHYVLSHY